MSRLDLPVGIGRVPLASPALDLMRAEEVGSSGWWQWIAATGTPLHLPGAVDGTEVLVFLYRDGQAGGAYVDLIGLTDREDLSTGAMDRVAGTDVWCAAFGVPSDFVGSYSLISHDAPLVSPGPRDTDEARAWWVSVLATARPDPLGTGAAFAGLRDGRRSIASASASAGAGAAAPRARCSSTAPMRGELVATTWRRPDVDRDQRVWVYVPTARPGEVVALAVVFDGQVWSAGVPLLPVLDELIDDGALPATAAVLLDSGTPDERRDDLTCRGTFIDAIADDLIPGLVSSVLSARGLVATRDPGATVVGGQSYGGLAAFYAPIHRPDRFGASLSQSGSFWWPDLQDTSTRRVATWLRTAPPRTARAVIQVGLFEGDLTEANREVAALVTDRGEWLRFTEVPGGHDWAWWGVRFGAGLVELLGDRGVVRGASAGGSST
ncbi:enterochelin esterase [Pengzhenrongella frigida]|uniref:Enterochelin esterase n=1 Tax=Pengzhenrongella frigida TaxID=1259133 RepID=A0A4Q5MXL1_9MICO|nr:enterochelin esterase [Cellulomonas sp. HLT2-17]RYV50492.1 enterochelin esterase [Cellulomonas sp. HLT2-17]